MAARAEFLALFARSCTFRCMRKWGHGQASRGLLVLVGIGAVAAIGCKKDGSQPAAALTVSSAAVAKAEAPVVVISKRAKLAATGMHTAVYAQPNTTKKIGYLRLGSIVPRSDTSYGTDGCPGGWYGVAPQGFVCAGKHATLDLETPMVRAAKVVRPDISRPLPYAYGFMRSVSPLYLRLPSRAEQEKQEYKLANHFRWFANHADEQKVSLGANDLAKELMPDAAQVPPSDQTPDGILLGGKTNEDPPPFWIENGNRSIPNVTGFDVQPESFFANRIKRHTGVSFIGAFDAGPNLDHRRFAVTVDMRLLPIDKVKPETASPFHGVELIVEMKLPVAFARPCEPHVRGEPLKPCRHVYRPSEDGRRMKRDADVLPSRAFLQLTGMRKVVDEVPFLETKAGYWVRVRDVGVAMTPHRWPGAAERGEKWIDISIEDETLVLWEGKKPVFVTLVSAGQDGLQGSEDDEVDHPRFLPPEEQAHHRDDGLERALGAVGRRSARSKRRRSSRGRRQARHLVRAPRRSLRAVLPRGLRAPRGLLARSLRHPRSHGCITSLRSTRCASSASPIRRCRKAGTASRSSRTRAPSSSCTSRLTVALEVGIDGKLRYAAASA